MISLDEINKRMAELNDWSIEDGKYISKSFEFSDFKEARDFVDKVGSIAEEINHHPEIVWNYNLVKISITTHSEGGLTEKDFEMAKEIDNITPGN